MIELHVALRLGLETKEGLLCDAFLFLLECISFFE